MNPKDKPGYAYNYLINKGLSKEAAAGIVGNLQAESGLDTTIKGTADDKGSIGIAQWHSGRKRGLLNFAKQQNRDYDDLDLQLDYIVHELDQPEYKIAKNKISIAKNPQEAALAFMNHYEKPAEWAKKQSMGQRVGVAQSLYANTPANYEGVKQQIQYDDRPVGDYYTDSTVNLNQDSGEYMTAPDYEAPSEYEEDVEGNTAKEELRQAQQEKNFLEDIGRQNQMQQEEVSQGYPQNSSGYELYMPELPEFQAQQTPSYFENGGTQGGINYEVFNKELKRFAEGGDFAETYAEDEESPFGAAPKTFQEELSKSFGVPQKPTTKPTPNPATKKAETTSKGDELISKYGSKPGEKIVFKDLPRRQVTGVREGTGNIQEQVLEKKQELKYGTKKEILKEIEDKKNRLNLSEINKELASKATLEDSIENKDIDLKLSDFKSQDQVKKLQSFLVEKGYNLNPEGKFENSGIDGKAGKVTLKAIQQYNQNLSNNGYSSIKEGKGLLGKCTESQCSEYSQNELFRNVQPNVSRDEWNAKTGITGDAWSIGKNIISKGGQEVKPKQVQAGDVITVYTHGISPFQKEADAAGTGTTHVGIVDKVNPDGSYYILHNLHKGNKEDGFEGREYRDLVKANEIQGHSSPYTVKHIFRPNYGSVENGEKKIVREDLAIRIDPKKSAALSTGDYNNFFTSASAKTKLETSFIKPLNDNKNKKVLSKVFNLGDDEYNSLAKASLGILGQETGFGTSAKYTTGIKQTIAKSAHAVGLKKDEASQGAGQLKYESNFGNDDVTELGITKDNFSDENNASLTTMYKLSKDYKKFLDKGFSKKDAMYRAITTYNSTMGRVVNGKKIEDWAKDYDVDYTNKVLNYANMFDVSDKKKSYKTTSDNLLLQKNVAKWKASLKSQNKL